MNEYINICNSEDLNEVYNAIIDGMFSAHNPRAYIMHGVNRVIEHLNDETIRQTRRDALYILQDMVEKLEGKSGDSRVRAYSVKQYPRLDDFVNHYMLIQDEELIYIKIGGAIKEAFVKMLRRGYGTYSGSSISTESLLREVDNILYETSEPNAPERIRVMQLGVYALVKEASKGRKQGPLWPDVIAKLIM